MYDSSTEVTVGGILGKRMLSDIPSAVLLERYNNGQLEKSNKKLWAYVSLNKSRLEESVKYEKKEPEEYVGCRKYTYASKKIAMEVVRNARDHKQKNKKPVRAYECNLCGGWHLTSIPYEEWNKRKII